MYLNAVSRWRYIYDAENNVIYENVFLNIRYADEVFNFCILWWLENLSEQTNQNFFLFGINKYCR